MIQLGWEPVCLFWSIIVHLTNNMDYTKNLDTSIALACNHCGILCIELQFHQDKPTLLGSVNTWDGLLLPTQPLGSWWWACCYGLLMCHQMEVLLFHWEANCIGTRAEAEATCLCVWRRGGPSLLLRGQAHWQEGRQHQPDEKGDGARARCQLNNSEETCKLTAKTPAWWQQQQNQAYQCTQTLCNVSCG